jgi:CysZ protein
VLRAIGLAVADLGDRRALGIVLQSLGIALLIFAVLAVATAWFLSGFDPCGAVGLDSCPLDAGSATVTALLLTLVAAWFLFPAIALTVNMTFADRIGRTIEELHYPAAAQSARPIGIAGGLGMGLRSGGRLLLFNLIALPFYLLLLVTGVGPFILFVIINGLAFGRDIGELAAARHGDRESRRAWLRSTRSQQYWIGILVSILFLVPIANLVAPIIGVAAGIHLFNRSFWSRNTTG